LEEVGTYSKRAPAVDQASVGNNECGTVTGDELGKFSAFREVVGINGSRLSFRRVQAFTIIIGITVRVFIGNVLHLSLLFSFAAQGTLIIDTPSQYFVVVGKSSAVHAADCQLDNTNGLRRQQVVEARTLNIDRFLSAVIFVGS
jgi:hypothetical protein